MTNDLLYFSISRKQIREDIRTGAPLKKRKVPSGQVYILYCRSGAVELVHDAGSFLTKSGFVCILSSGYAYGIRGHVKGEMYLLEVAIQIYHDCLKYAGWTEKNTEKKLTYEENGVLRYMMSAAICHPERMETLMEELLLEEQERQPGYLPMYQGIVMQMMVLIRRSFSLTEESSRQGEASRIRTYIFDHCMNLNVRDVAEKFHYHPNSINRMLKKEYQMNFTELLREGRMYRAGQLLRSSRLPVRTIAASCGYANTSFFYRIFQETYGMSPALYREMYMGVSDSDSAKQ